MNSVLALKLRNMTMKVENVFYDIGETVDLGINAWGIMGSVLSLDTCMGAILNCQDSLDVSRFIKPVEIENGESVSFNGKLIQGT